MNLLVHKIYDMNKKIKNQAVEGEINEKDINSY